jgi:hypothetical protein
MARSARMTKKFRKKVLKFNEIQCVGLTEEEWLRTLERMELYDSLNEEERALVQEYGLAKAYKAIRLFYGRPTKARTFLEEQRNAALPVSLRRSIT